MVTGTANQKGADIQCSSPIWCFAAKVAAIYATAPTRAHTKTALSRVSPKFVGQRSCLLWARMRRGERNSQVTIMEKTARKGQKRIHISITNTPRKTGGFALPFPPYVDFVSGYAVESFLVKAMNSWHSICHVNIVPQYARSPFDRYPYSSQSRSKTLRTTRNRPGPGSY